MIKQNILLLSLFGFIILNFGCCSHQEVERNLLNKLLKSTYDKRIRPVGQDGYEGPTIVETNMYIRDIDFIDEQKKIFQMQMTLRQRWLDRRLAYNFSTTPSVEDNLRFLTLTDINEVWTPDMFFSNDKTAKIHDLMKPNTFIRIFPNGTVYQSARISVSLSCPMMYRRFPFDTQTCTARMASYGYTNKDIVFKWQEFEPVLVTPSLHINDFRLVDFSTETCDTKTATGVYSCLKLDFSLWREFKPYLINVFIPCTMMIIVAWLGTFLDKRSVTARSLVSLSTLYVMTTFVMELKKEHVSTSYTKAIDVWTGICLTFVMSTFTEFVIVSCLTKSEVSKEDSGEEHLIGKPKGLQAVKKWLVGYTTLSDKIESVFRTVYPIAFILFVAMYFLAYLS